MTQRVTFLVAFDLPAKVDRETIRKALQTIVDDGLRVARGLEDTNPHVSVVHHPTVRRGE